MIWASNNKWGSKLRQKQAPQNRSTPRLLPPTWASAAESPGPKHQGQESPQGSPSLPLGLPKGPEHGATARQWPREPSAPQRVNLQEYAEAQYGCPSSPPSYTLEKFSSGLLAGVVLDGAWSNGIINGCGGGPLLVPS